MKAILEFDLPEDDYDFRAAAKATKLRVAMSNFKEWLFQRQDEGYWDKSGEKECKEIWNNFIEEFQGIMEDE